MPITKTEAQSSIKKVSTSLTSLTPTTLITLFEIDINTLATDRLVNLGVGEGIFRFHNNIKLFETSIWWGNPEYEYIAAPIAAEGFEMNARGTLPTPKLIISVSPDGIPTLALLKNKIAQFDDLIGAKVTRIRTWAENLNPTNFNYEDCIPFNVVNNTTQDSFAELPRDIYYIDRKSNENKSTIEFELASILDVEGVKLPNRLVLANRCTATYRCEGCLYEYQDNFIRDSSIDEPEVFGDATFDDLLSNAPPVATEKNELIQDILGSDVTIQKSKEHKNENLTSYIIGSSVWIKKNGVRYHFVCKVNNPSAGPPDSRYWIADACSKTVKGCKLRWGNSVRGLPFNGFPSANSIR